MTFTHLGIDIPEINTETIDGKRYYVTPTGEKYPSITTVLGHFNKKNMGVRQRVGEKKLTKFPLKHHAEVLKYIKCVKTLSTMNLMKKKFMPSDRETFNSIKNILSENINNVRVQEATLYSDYLRVAGRVDCIADWNNRLSVIDFKTSRKLKRKNILRIIFNKVLPIVLCMKNEQKHTNRSSCNSYSSRW